VNIVRLQHILPLYICWSSQWLQRWHICLGDTSSGECMWTAGQMTAQSHEQYVTEAILEVLSTSRMSIIPMPVPLAYGILKFFRILLNVTHSGLSIASMLTLCLTSWYLRSQSSAALSRNAFRKVHPRSSKQRSASSHKSPVCECMTGDTPLYTQLGIARLLERLTIRTRIRSVRETIHVNF